MQVGFLILRFARMQQGLLLSVSLGAIHMPTLKLVTDWTAEITLDVLPTALRQPYCEKSGTQVGIEAIQMLPMMW